MISMGDQFQVVTKLTRQLTIPRALVDPLKEVWQLIKQKANSMHIVPLVDATWFYHRLGKNQEAFEIGQICLRRLSQRDELLRIFLEHLMGEVSYQLCKFGQAISHILSVLQEEERLLRSTSHTVLNGKILLARAYNRDKRSMMPPSCSVYFCKIILRSAMRNT